MIESKLIMIPVLMVTIISFTSLISIIYAGKEDKPKEYCEDYGGEWSVKKRTDVRLRMKKRGHIMKMMSVTTLMIH